MKVSVLIITYNQEEFIAQAINSALMQEVSFDYEIIIGEDASTDRTREIVLELEKEYPDRIRVLLHDRLAAERDRALGLGGRAGFLKCLEACRGQYVALLEGDDYWIDVHKLQKQVDFLESDPDFAICCHNVTVFYEDGSKEPANLIPPDQKEVSTLEDLLFINFLPTCSVVFRRGLFGVLPEWYSSLTIGDWPLHIMNARHGKIGYINEVMGVYRVHHSGFWTSMDPLPKLFEIIRMLDYIDGYLDRQYSRQIKAAKANWYNEVLRVCYDKGNLNVKRHQVGKLFWYCDPAGRRKLVSLLLRQRAPAVYRSLRTLRSFAHSREDLI
jgi:glycosyltransferase involved in cell wall biosynthesis